MGPSISNATTISSIKITRQNVFDSEVEKENWFVYRWANSLHIKTREWVIRDQLLYEIGDKLDTLRILETERNLRSLEFIGGAITRIYFNSDSSEADIELTVSDQWSTIAGPTSEGSGSDYTIGFALSEKNLFGLGKDLMAEYYTGNDRKGSYINYFDYNLFRTRLRGHVEWENDGLVRTASYELTRPLYSLSDRYSFSLSGQNMVGNTRYFYAGNEIFRYRSEKQNYTLSITRSFGIYFKRDFKIDLSWNNEKHSNSPEFDRYRMLIPPSRTETRLDLTSYLGVSKYKTTTLFDNFGNVEDLTFGWWFSVSTGRSFDILDGDIVRNYGGVGLKTTFEYPQNIYISASLSASARNNGGFENAFYSQRYYLYVRYPKRMVSAFRLISGFYDRPDPYIVNYIGGKFGLRGFDNYKIVGQNYAIANCEQRYYSPLKIMTVALGVAAFLDVGKSWYENGGYTSADWKADAGAGFRFGLTKSSGFKVLRIDLAKSLSENIYFLSFGTQMYFGFGS